MTTRPSRLCAAAAAAACAWACESAPPPPPAAPVSLSDGTYAMGTVLETTLFGDDADALAAATEELFGTARRLDALLSTYQPASDVSRLNGAAGAGPVEVDPHVVRILQLSQSFTALTRGTFDISVGPLVELWTRAGERGELPSRAELDAARTLVGPRVFRVRGNAAWLLRPGASLDLGGVAKGYALDEMLPLLRARGIGTALLNFGQSSTWALGAPPDSPEGWRLLARAPDGGFLGVLTLRDRALSVSGTLGQWTEIGGRRYGHVLDPRTGQPLTRRRQAIVVAPSAALGEALSKALLVLGETEGIRLVGARRGCEGLLADADGGVWTTAGFTAATRFEGAGFGTE